MSDTHKIFACVAVVLLNATLCTVAVGQDKATVKEVMAKVKEAASTLSKTGDVGQFNQKQGPWVWKDTYIFVEDCNKKIMAAHPMRPDLVGKDLKSIKDAKGENLYPDPEGFCKSVKVRHGGIWHSGLFRGYWWPKPGEEVVVRKLTYHLSAEGTPYVVSSGVMGK
jgi:hypothetical protein